METFPERLIRLRKENNLSQEELGKKVGLKRAAISKMENGSTLNPKRSTIDKLAKVFNVSGSYILCMTDKRNIQEEQISPSQFMSEVKSLLDKTDNLTEQQKQYLISNLEFICSDDE